MTTQVLALNANHVGPGEPQQRRQDRAVEQRVLFRRRRRRQRTLVLVYGNFGDGNIGHFVSRAQSGLLRRGCCPTTIGAGFPVHGAQGGPARLRASAVFQPIDQTNGAFPPADGFKCTGIWRPQPAARPSNRPFRTLAQAG